MAWRFQEFQYHASEANFVAVAHRHVLQGRIGCCAQIDFRAGLGCELNMAANEIGMQVSFNDVLDLEPLRAGFVQIERDVALRVHHAGHALRPQHVRSVRQAGQIELLKVHLLRLLGG